VFADAYICREIERSPVRGGILANDCGIGKTIIYLTAICIDILDLKHRYEAGEEGINFHPSLIVIPSYLIPQVFNEIAYNFKELLVPHIYCGVARKSYDPFQ